MENSKFVILREIIDHYEVYEQQERENDLLSFTRWMQDRLQEASESNPKKSANPAIENTPKSDSVFIRLDERARFLETVSRIARYHEFYIRKALKDLIINTRQEFLFLQIIQSLGKVKKTDLINILHLEYSTGMDTIRRLTNSGLVHEIQDTHDKRARLLALTEKGESLLGLAIKRVLEENRMFFSAISDNKWKKARMILEDIDAFHNVIYQKHNDKSFSELCNLVDSLKHLHK